MPLDLIAPIYTSYAYQYNGATIFTQQSIDKHSSISLFSTIVHPGRPNKHCWTTGHLEGSQYVFRSESIDVGNSKRTEVFTTSLPLPLSCKSFIVPFPSPSFYLPPSYPTLVIPGESGQYGSWNIPLPDDDGTGYPSHRSSSAPTTTDHSTSEFPASDPMVPLRRTPVPVQRNSPNSRRHQRHEEEMLSPPQSYGTTGTCFWSTLHMD